MTRIFAQVEAALLEVMGAPPGGLPEAGGWCWMNPEWSRCMNRIEKLPLMDWRPAARRDRRT